MVKLTQWQMGAGWQGGLMIIALTLGPIVGGLLLSPRATLAQSPAPIAQQSERVLSVTGEGTQMLQTTLTQVSLSVIGEGQTAQDAQQQAAQRQTAVIEWLRSQNVDKLETTGISLNPRYDYTNDRQVLRGYEANQTVSFRIATEQAGAIMDEAVNVGATRIDGVSFVAEDEAIEAARQQALAAAVEDAQQQADTVLSALGLSRQEVVNITIGSTSAPPPRPVQARAMAVAESDAATTPIVGQEQTIRGQVTLHIRY
ncbi:MAG: SIMPL domain-containing protein [Phormidesmis sp.]